MDRSPTTVPFFVMLIEFFLKGFAAESWRYEKSWEIIEITSDIHTLASSSWQLPAGCHKNQAWQHADTASKFYSSNKVSRNLGSSASFHTKSHFHMLCNTNPILPHGIAHVPHVYVMEIIPNFSSIPDPPASMRRTSTRGLHLCVTHHRDGDSHMMKMGRWWQLRPRPAMVMDFYGDGVQIPVKLPYDWGETSSNVWISGTAYQGFDS